MNVEIEETKCKSYDLSYIGLDDTILDINETEFELINEEIGLWLIGEIDEFWTFGEIINDEYVIKQDDIGIMLNQTQIKIIKDILHV